MPRLLGVEIPGNKKIEYALRYMHGIGPARASEIVERTGLDRNAKADDLSSEELSKLIEALQAYPIEGDLRREVAQNIRRLISINCYRGLRHRRGLPVRGQRTSSNARTRKGKKQTVGTVRGREARSQAKQK